MQESSVPEGCTEIPTVVTFIIRSLWHEQVSFCCPVCGFEYVHPDRVLVVQGNATTEIVEDKTFITPAKVEFVRGSKIALRFHCENHHGFEYELQFHKGNLICHLNAWDINGSEPPKELWRN